MPRRGWPVWAAIVALCASTVWLSACATRTASPPGAGADTGGSASPAPAPLRPSNAQILEAYGRLPLHFEENQGQADPAVRFVARTEGGPVGLTPEGIGLGVDGGVVRLTFAGAAPAPRMEALDPLPGRINYYLGRDRSHWRTGIPTAARVRYEAVYPGVDVVVYGNKRRLEYDFVVAPGADPGRIRVRVDGADTIGIDRAGGLEIRRGGRTIVQHAPVIYQEREGRREPVTGRYVLRGREVALAVGAYDRTRALVIDPVVEFSAKIGPAVGTAITVDPAGFIIVAGESSGSSGYPMVNAAFGPTHCCFTDAVVTKLTPNADALVYSTFIGTTANEQVVGIVTDSAGNAWVLGNGVGHGALGPAGFPTTPDAAMPTGPGGSDSAAGWLAKFSPTGGLLYGTYITGTSSAPDFLPSGACLRTITGGLAIDASDNVYVVGETTTVDYPTTPGAYQTSRAGDPNTQWCHGGGSAAFVTKFTPSGALAYSTYLDTAATRDVATAVAVDAAGNAYVGGAGAPPPFPITTALTADGGTQGGYVVKLDANGVPTWATSVGAMPQALVLGPDGSVYFVDPTVSSAGSSPTTVNALQSTPAGSGDSFVARLAAAGNAYVWATYFGGAASDALNGIAVDPEGAAWLVGFSASSDFPLKDATKTKEAATEVVVVKLSADGALLFSTFLGSHQGWGVTTDPAGNVYLTGAAGSDFPATPGTYGSGSATGLFVLKYVADQAGGAEPVVWTSPVKVAVGGNTITKNAGCNGCADAGAISQQTIASGNGSVEFKVSAGASLMAGLSTGNPGTSGSEIKFGLRFFPGYVEVRESGVWKESWPIAAGDVHKVAVDGGAVKYFQDGTLKYTSTVAPTYPLLVDASLFKVGSAVQKAMITGAGGGGGTTPPPDATPPTVAITSPESGATVSGTVTIDANATDNVGVAGVQFKVDGVNIGAQDTSAPYSIAWDSTTVANGTHTLSAVATDDAGNTATAAITVTVSNDGPPSPPGGQVVWTSAVNVAVSGNTITKNAGCTGCWDAGAVSQQTIASGNASVSFGVPAGAALTAGLSTGNAGTSASEITFGLRFFPAATPYVEVRESGVWKASWTVTPGAIHTVAVEGGVVKYYQNGVLKHTSAAAPTYPLLVDATIETVGGAVQSAVLGP